MFHMKLLIVAMVVWNLITFFMMGADKYRAKKDKPRIREKTLIIAAFAMGALGVTIGAAAFHHKTQKLKFRVLLPIGIIVNGAVIYGLFCLNII